MDTNHTTMVSEPNRWPKWPWLPLKRWNHQTCHYDCALLHADDGTDRAAKVTLYEVNLYAVRTWFPTQEMPVAQVFPDWASFVQSDWLVD
jgi:hypothetical protein